MALMLMTSTPLLLTKQNTMTYTLGIDFHKQSSVWILINDERKEIWKASVACHPDDINTAIKKMPVPPGEVRVAIEPVGGWRWATQQLTAAGMDVHIAHPQKVRLIAQSNAKHDAGDAKMLAELLRSGFFPEAYRVSDEIYHLRTMLRERNFIIKLRTSAKNRLHGIATTQGLHKIKGGNPLHKKGKEGIMQSDNTVLKELHQLIEDLDKRMIPFDAFIEEEVPKHTIAKLLMTMPSVGKITALTVIAEVGDFARFPSGEKLTNFAGLVPRQRSSGAIVKFGSITNAGSPFLRSAMVETAMRIRKEQTPELYEFVERLKPSCGAKRARVALGRKMLAIMWTMVKKNTPYDQATFVSALRNATHEQSRRKT
jgi:transposase